MKRIKSAKAQIFVRSIPKGSKTYLQKTITIPATIWKDTAFPFDDKEVVSVILDTQNKRLIIEKLKDTEGDNEK